MIKNFFTIKNNRTSLAVDKAISEETESDKDKVLFQMPVDSNGEIIITPAESVNNHSHQEAFRQLLKENDSLIKKLSQR